MFYDRAKVYVKGGDGGNGIVAFRREKYVPEGGPSGGDGGHGGNTILVADSGLRTLVDFKYKKHYKAPRGGHGGGKHRHGKSAEDLLLRVPVGTLIYDDDSGEVLADLVEEGQQVIVARGGRGGKGNARFASALNRVPRMAEKGEPGEEHWLRLELKLLADVGLVGFPNVGKSTIISRISAAKPKIADYPFTTLVPNLGVVIAGEGRSFVVADIPGIIEGAHEGSGLGYEFLKHIERTRILVFVLAPDNLGENDLSGDLATLERELGLYNPALAGRRRLLAVNKMDLPGSEERLEQLRTQVGERYEIYPVSAITGQGLDNLVNRLAELLDVEEPVTLAVPVPETRITKAIEQERFAIEYDHGIYTVSGREVERHIAMTDLDSDAGLQRLQHIFRKMGVIAELRARGARPGDTVQIKGIEFEFLD
ncbi:MAG: GTPase ObgE [Bacillota bacterium]